MCFFVDPKPNKVLNNKNMATLTLNQHDSENLVNTPLQKPIRLLTLILLSILLNKSNAQFGTMGNMPMNTFPFQSGNGFSQPKFMLMEGNVKMLRNSTIKVKIELDTALRFVKEEEAIKEEEFVKRFSEELNEKKTGKGDQWKNEWYEVKSFLYRDNFIESFNKNIPGDSKLAFVDTGDVVLNIVIKKIFAPSFDFAGTNPLQTFVECTFVDSEGKIICRYEISDCPGRGRKTYYYINGVVESMRKLAADLFYKIYPEL